MRILFLNHRAKLAVFCFLSLSLQASNAQFFDLTAEIEMTQWPPGRASIYTAAVHCVVGTNSWEIDSELGTLRTKSWYTGTEIIESLPARVMDSLDGNPSLPVRHGDRLEASERIAWLAFCSGPCLKRKGHQLFPPGDLWKEMILAPFLEHSTVFENGFGFPKSVDLHTTNGQPVLQFRVTATTNILGQVFPSEFSLAQYRPAFGLETHRLGTNGWELHITAKGKLSRVSLGTEPQVPASVVAAAQKW